MYDKLIYAEMSGEGIWVLKLCLGPCWGSVQHYFSQLTFYSKIHPVHWHYDCIQSYLVTTSDLMSSGVARNLLRGTNQGVWVRKSLAGSRGRIWKP